MIQVGECGSLGSRNGSRVGKKGMDLEKYQEIKSRHDDGSDLGRRVVINCRMLSDSHKRVSWSLLILTVLFTALGFPGGSVVKNLPANAGDAGLIPNLRRSPRKGNGHPLQYSCLENPHEERSLAGYSPWSCRAGLVTEQQFTSAAAMPNNCCRCPVFTEQRDDWSEWKIWGIVLGRRTWAWL